jgi:hypothetical protein
MGDPETLSKIELVLKRVGVEFIDENGGPGVRPPQAVAARRHGADFTERTQFPSVKSIREG